MIHPSQAWRWRSCRISCGVWQCEELLVLKVVNCRHTNTHHLLQHVCIGNSSSVRQNYLIWWLSMLALQFWVYLPSQVQSSNQMILVRKRCNSKQIYNIRRIGQTDVSLLLKKRKTVQNRHSFLYTKTTEVKSDSNKTIWGTIQWLFCHFCLMLQLIMAVPTKGTLVRGFGLRSYLQQR